MHFAVAGKKQASPRDEAAGLPCKALHRKVPQLDPGRAARAVPAASLAVPHRQPVYGQLASNAGHGLGLDRRRQMPRLRRSGGEVVQQQAGHGGLAGGR